MKEIYCRDLAKHHGKRITSFFLVATKQCRKKRNGELYLHLVLCDRSGAIDAKLWTVDEHATAINADDLVSVQAIVQEYQGREELSIEKIRKADASEVELSDFVPHTEESVDVMWAHLCEFVETIQSLSLRSLLRAVVTDEQISSRFRRAPAATSLHHAFLGGLLEHVLSVCRFCDLAHRNYDWLNRDLLLAGAIVHDIGKIQELGYERAFTYTERGQLAGHIVLGVELLREKAQEIGTVAPELMAMLEHMILSHHGELQFGSPVQPILAEALLFHYLDNADSKMASIREALRRAGPESVWTERVASIGRRVIQTQAFLKGNQKTGDGSTG